MRKGQANGNQVASVRGSRAKGRKILRGFALRIHCRLENSQVSTPLPN